jgi:hypothetical protein
MKNSTIILIYRALQSLDGSYDESTKKVTPYKFGGSTAYAIAKNMKRSKAAVDLIEEVRVSIAKSILKEGETEIKASDARFADFQREYIALLDADGDFVPHKITVSSLNLAQNSIQPSVLLALEELLIDDDAPSPAPAPVQA